MKIYTPIILALLLAGCVNAGARFITYEAELETALVNMVRENGDTRRTIRAKCRDRLWARVDRLDKAGQEDEADRILDANYPAPLTVQLLKAYKSEEGYSALSHPWGCRAALLPTFSAETGLLE